uniref:Aminotransferase class I/classII domain-containing protein n=1 Tax=Globodera rostochiensis TaxID=31243 RepID=A0A914HEL8_GLORO
MVEKQHAINDNNIINGGNINGQIGGTIVCLDLCCEGPIDQCTEMLAEKIIVPSFWAGAEQFVAQPAPLGGYESVQKALSWHIRHLLGELIQWDQLHLVSNTSVALELFVQCCCSPGDILLYPTPFADPELAGAFRSETASIDIVPVHLANASLLDIADLQHTMKRIGKRRRRVRALLLHNPHPIVGCKGNGQRQLAHILEWAVESKIFLLVDESLATMDLWEFSSCLGLDRRRGDELGNWLVWIWSGAKHFSLPGLEFAAILLPRPALSLLPFQPCAPLVQYLVANLLEDLDWASELFARRKSRLKELRRRTIEGMADLGLSKTLLASAEPMPWILVDLKMFLDDINFESERTLREELAKRTGLKLTSGEQLGMANPGWFRVRVEGSEDKISDVLVRLKMVLAGRKGSVLEWEKVDISPYVVLGRPGAGEARPKRGGGGQREVEQEGKARERQNEDESESNEEGGRRISLMGQVGSDDGDLLRQVFSVEDIRKKGSAAETGTEHAAKDEIIQKVFSIFPKERLHWKGPVAESGTNNRAEKVGTGKSATWTEEAFVDEQRNVQMMEKEGDTDRRNGTHFLKEHSEEQQLKAKVTVTTITTLSDLAFIENLVRSEKTDNVMPKNKMQLPRDGEYYEEVSTEKEEGREGEWLHPSAREGRSEEEGREGEWLHPSAREGRSEEEGREGEWLHPSAREGRSEEEGREGEWLHPSAREGRSEEEGREGEWLHPSAREGRSEEEGREGEWLHPSAREGRSEESFGRHSSDSHFAFYQQSVRCQHPLLTRSDSGMARPQRHRRADWSIDQCESGLRNHGPTAQMLNDSVSTEELRVKDEEGNEGGKWASDGEGAITVDLQFKTPKGFTEEELQTMVVSGGEQREVQDEPFEVAGWRPLEDVEPELNQIVVGEIDEDILQNEYDARHQKLSSALDEGSSFCPKQEEISWIEVNVDKVGAGMPPWKPLDQLEKEAEEEMRQGGGERDSLKKRQRRISVEATDVVEEWNARVRRKMKQVRKEEAEVELHFVDGDRMKREAASEVCWKVRDEEEYMTVVAVGDEPSEERTRQNVGKGRANRWRIPETEKRRWEEGPEDIPGRACYLQVHQRMQMGRRLEDDNWNTKEEQWINTWAPDEWFRRVPLREDLEDEDGTVLRSIKTENPKEYGKKSLVCRNPTHTASSDHCEPRKAYSIRRPTAMNENGQKKMKRAREGPTYEASPSLYSEIETFHHRGREGRSTVRTRHRHKWPRKRLQQRSPSRVTVTTTIGGGEDAQSEPIDRVTVSHTPGSRWIVSSVYRTTEWGWEKLSLR